MQMENATMPLEATSTGTEKVWGTIRELYYELKVWYASFL